MKKLISLFLAIAVLVGALAMPLTAAAGGEKVTLCHKPGTPDEVTIEVSVNALDAHLAHGDYVGECSVVTVLTCPFEATAIPVIGPDYVMYMVEFPEPPAGFGWDVVISSSTGQEYLWTSIFSGESPPSYWLPMPGYPLDLGWPGGPSVYDAYVMKLNPEDPDFNHIVSCTAVEVLSP